LILLAHLHTQNTLRKFVDFFVLIVVWPLSFAVRFYTPLFELPLGEDSFVRYLKLLPLVLLSYAAVFAISGFYKRSLEVRRVWEDNFDIMRTHLLAFGVFLAFAYVLDNHRYSRVMLGIYFCMVPVGLAFGCSIVRKYGRKKLSKESRQVRTLLIADESKCPVVLEEVKRHPEWVLDVFKVHLPWELNLIEQSLLSSRVQLVLVCQTLKGSNLLLELSETLSKSLCEVIYIPDFGIQTYIPPKMISLGSFPGVAVNSSDLNASSAILKRTFDICFSSMFLLVFAPVYLICALLVKISSRGPVFYKQERMGLDGSKFQCIKFRGMLHNAESESGPKWATKNDDRTTWVGKWLRKTSLDEIPQFWNVLKGEMSVVGPRPERPVFVENFKHQVPGYMLRHKVKAGITGWAQINGWRGDTSLEKRIECDLWYVQNWSLWLDLKICLMTPLKGLVHPNAY
jgi:exopolysaccharide biosynthesis polyprenyl glycosylphosphotransferase